jgi:predicted PurR-regulated permease PerM
MGMWGFILGVPISVYFFRQISSNGHKRNGNHLDKPGEGPPPPPEAAAASA